MKRVRPWEPARTYGDNTSHGVSESIVSRAARNRVDGGVGVVDDTGELADDSSRAPIVRAAAELGNDVVALGAEVGENLLDILDRPLCDDLRERTGKDHGTGSKDTEDGRKTHDEEVRGEG